MHDGADGQPPSGEAKKTKESYLVELKHPDTPAQFWVSLQVGRSIDEAACSCLHRSPDTESKVVT